MGNRRIVGMRPRPFNKKQGPMMTVSLPTDADALRIRHEFVALPGMCLAVPQAARLLGVSSDHAADMLEALEEEGFLIHTADGQYRRAEPLPA